MKKIAVFYHCIFSGGTVPIDIHFALSIMSEQMGALNRSGLTKEMNEFFIGVNGDERDAKIALMLSPRSDTIIIPHGNGSTTEIPTLVVLRDWLKNHPDWYVLYHHMKGVTHPNEPLYAVWRRRMENAVVLGWRNCITDMDNGYDSCGAHWLTPEQFPGQVSSPFWGGTFWWATAKYLLTLPQLPPATWANRFEAENWICRGPNRPKVRDYFPGWP